MNELEKEIIHLTNKNNLLNQQLHKKNVLMNRAIKENNPNLFNKLFIDHMN